LPYLSAAERARLAPALRAVQHRLIASGKIQYFNSPDHDTTRINVAAGQGICLAPGFLNDHSGQFAWISFDCEERFSCVLCTHKVDNRPSMKEFLAILQKLYDDAIAFPLWKKVRQVAILVEGK